MTRPARIGSFSCQGLLDGWRSHLTAPPHLRISAGLYPAASALA